MSGSAVTPSMRAHGWNIHLLAGSDHFAGLYHPHGSQTLTYQNIIEELTLCFQIKGSDTDEEIAFGHAGFLNCHPQLSHKRFIHASDLDQWVQAPEAAADVAEPSISRFHVLWHRPSGSELPDNVSAHLRGMF